MEQLLKSKHLSIDKRLRLVSLYERNNLHFMPKRFVKLQHLATQENIAVSQDALRRLMKKYHETGTVADKKSNTRAIGHTKVSQNELNAIDRKIFKNRHLSAKKIKLSLNLIVATRTVQKYINLLGWSKVRTRFCQFVTLPNRIDRLVFAELCLVQQIRFLNSIHIDESIIQATKNANRMWFQVFPTETRLGLVGRYSHIFSVQVIGGISRRGPTNLEIYSGRLNSACFQVLLARILPPDMDQQYLCMDNAPCHVSRSSKDYLETNEIFHFKTPAQSPDLNPIELVWHDLKVFIANEVKPNNRNELIAGILYFWRNKVTIEYCNKKIDHLQRVLHTIINLNGKATGL